MSTIPLAKGVNEKKLNFPVYLSQKIDGVPVRIDIYPGCYKVRTRQDKPVPAVQNMVHDFVQKYMEDPDAIVPISFVGEVHQKGDPWANFKDTSGIVRRQEDQSHKLEIAIFECSSEAGETFEERSGWMDSVLGYCGLQQVYQKRVDSIEELWLHYDTFMGQFKHAEGMVARNHDDPWCPGKRSWGYQKLLREPTIDLWITGCQEAHAEDGTPKGMAGRLIAKYKGEEIGIGPGKLSHKERVHLLGYFQQPHSGPRMAQIKYKDDPSYDALRQPTFQCWRDEKVTADA